MTTITSADQQRIARAMLTYLAEPADPAVCGLLQVLSPAELMTCIRSGTLPASATDLPGGVPAAKAALRHYRDQLAGVPADAGLASCPSSRATTSASCSPGCLGAAVPARTGAMWYSAS